jgi:hypothetical protein
LTTTYARIKSRRDTAANWTSEDPTLAAGELAVELGTGLLKIGDGATAWTSLPYYAGTYTTVVLGARASPVGVTEPIASPTANDTLLFAEGNGAPQTIDNIGAAPSVGARLRLDCRSAVNTITLTAVGNIEVNGGTVVLQLGSVIDLFYDGIKYVEASRNGI